MTAIFSGPVAALAGAELRQAARSRWVVIGALTLAVTTGAISVLGGRANSDLGVASVDATVSALLQIAVLLPPLLALVLGAGAIAGSRDSGLLSMAAALPVSRRLLAGAAYLGLAGALGLMLAFGFGFSVLVITIGNGRALGSLLALAAVSAAATATALAAGLAISAWSLSRAQATGTAVGVWFLLALGHDLLLTAAVPAVGLSLGGTFLAIVANPLEAARIVGLLLLEGGTAALGPLGSYLVDDRGVAFAILVCGASLVLWTVAGLFGATVALRRRDL